GTLASTLKAIADQAKPITIVVRVAQGEEEAETTTNIIGGTTEEGLKTGLQALLASQAQHGIKPRIIGAPGHDTLAVANEIAVICQKLRAFGYVSAYDCKNISEAIKYRDN
ncbi:TPA: phage tail protein, partial [Proteus mirabilis]|nr:phage tail protein [Proteus mirabilis]